MANEENLIPAKKGEVRNPKGRGKGVPNTKTRLQRLLTLVEKMKNPVTGELEEFSVAEQLDMAMILQARKGNVKAWVALMDRLEGQPIKSVDISVKEKPKPILGGISDEDNIENDETLKKAIDVSDNNSNQESS